MSDSSRRMTTIGMSAVAVGMALAGTASAATLTQTQTIGPTPTDVVTTQLFNQFDPSLGTLTGVTISASASQGPPVIKATWNGTQPSAARSARYAFDWTSTIKQGSTIIATGANEAPANSDPFNPFTNWGSLALPAGLTTGQFVTFTNPAWGVSIANAINIPVGDFATYSGLGTVPIDINISNLFGISLPSNWNVQLTTLANSSVTIEYTYTPIPTPASASLVALAGLAAFRRRR
jgi:hypothetical protein